MLSQAEGRCSWWFIFTVLCSLFILSMFLRVMTAVIAPDLIREFRINAELLGILGGSFFYAFGVFQIPLGPMLDRIGPRAVMTTFSLVGSIGIMLFAVADTFVLAVAGRILMGIGMACSLIGSLKVFTLIIPNEKFGRFSGLLVAIGTLGNVLAASPFAYVSSVFGWRRTLLFVGAFSVVLDFLVLWALKGLGGKNGTSSPESGERRIGIFESLKIVSGSLAFWQISAPAFCRYGTFVALQGLWLGLYLMDVHDYSPLRAGNVLAMLAVGMTAGSLVAGWFYDNTQRHKKSVILCGLILYCVSLLPLTGILPGLNTLLYGLICFFIGFFSGFAYLLYADVKELFPVSFSGTAMAWVNFFVFAGGALFTHILGKVIELFPHSGRPYPPHAYYWAFAICVISMALGLVFYAFSLKRRPRLD